VLIPCYNAGRYVRATIESLRSQSVGDWECIVVDDGSTDESAAVVAGLAASDARISVVRQPNGGVSRARNRAYAESSPHSSYLLFLDSDDCLEANMLEVLVGYLERHPQVGAAFCSFTWVDQDDAPILANDPRLPDFLPTRFAPSWHGLRVLSPATRETPFETIFGAWAGLLPSNTLVRRTVYARTLGWNELLGQPSEDTDLFLQMALRGSIHYVAKPLVRYRRHTKQSTTDRARILAQDRKLFAKWARVDQFSECDARIVRQAHRFRETRILPYIAIRHGLSHMAAGHRVEGMKCFLRAAKTLALSQIRFTWADVQTRAQTRSSRAWPGSLRSAAARD
jgi:GT2 family glycosyltransferase